MNESALMQWLTWAGEHPWLLVVLGFLLALIEALAVIGVIVPGILMLFLLGTLIGWDVPLLLAVSAAVMAGAVTGDGVSYWLGRTWSGRLRSHWPFVRHRYWLDVGEQFFHRHGGKSVFIGRFIGPLRPMIPLVAGSLGMPPAQFVPRMLIACALWTPLMLLPGVLFGESLALAAEFGGRLTMLLLVLVIGAWLLLWSARAAYEAGARRAPWWLKNLALWLRRHALLGRWFGPLVEPGRREVLSVVILGLMLVLSLAALFGALLLAPLATAAWDAGFELSGLAASLRSHFADPLFFVVALAASWPVLVVLVVAIALVLAVQRRWNALVHWLLATAGGWALALLLNALMGALLGRPALAGRVGEVPGVHFAVVVLVFGFAALIVAKDFRPRQRKWLYLATVAWLALVAFAEFYLARATMIGLFAATALALGWLALTGIGYRLRAGRFAHPGAMLTGLAALWLGTAATVAATGYAGFAERHELTQPRRELALARWWQEGWRELPARRSRIGSGDDQRFDAQFAATEAQVRRRFREAGWQPPPAPTAAAIRRMLKPGAPPARRVHLRRDFAGQPEAIQLRRLLPDGRAQLLRAWDSGARLGVADTPVWLVQVDTLRPAVRLGFLQGWKAVDADDKQVAEAIRDAVGPWRQRRAGPGAPLLAAAPVGPGSR